MERMIPTLIILAVLAGVLVLMWFGWRARRRRDAGLPSVPVPPADLGAPDFALDRIHYVATTRAEDALDRLAVDPLAYRGRAAVEVHPSGVVIQVTGSRPAFIPRAAIAAIGTATATVDRAVERDGLVLISWWLSPEQRADTALRVADPQDRRALREALAPLGPASQTTSSAASAPTALPDTPTSTAQEHA